MCTEGTCCYGPGNLSCSWLSSLAIPLALLWGQAHLAETQAGISVYLGTLLCVYLSLASQIQPSLCLETLKSPCPGDVVAGRPEGTVCPLAVLGSDVLRHSLASHSALEGNLGTASSRDKARMCGGQ